MIEILWHGRGGQGAFTAARLLGAAAAFDEERFALAFPSFGPERRGAPIRAFTKISDTPIGDRSAIAKADFVIYLDETLLVDGWQEELAPGGVVLVNSTRSFDDARIVPIDADGISSAVLGRSIPNTVFLGALAALYPEVSLDSVKRAIEQYMPKKLHAANWEIVDEAYEAVKARIDSPHLSSRPSTEGISLSSSRPSAEDASPLSSRPSAEGASGEIFPDTGATHAFPTRAPGTIPHLRKNTLDPAQYAQNTCFEAGHLESKNAGWRNVRPVVHAENCTGCNQCYLYCPDGTVFMTDEVLTSKGKPTAEIDYDFCKGCGICAVACRFDAISMVPEDEVTL